MHKITCLKFYSINKTIKLYTHLQNILISGNIILWMSINFKFTLYSIKSFLYYTSISTSGFYCVQICLFELFYAGLPLLHAGWMKEFILSSCFFILLVGIWSMDTKFTLARIDSSHIRYGTAFHISMKAFFHVETLFEVWTHMQSFYKLIRKLCI